MLTDEADEVKIWEAARATSAAPTFFEPILIHGIPYTDGGIGWNNPTVEAIAGARQIWPKRPIGCLLSIGTGLKNAIPFSDGSGSESYSWFMNKLAPKSPYGLEIVAKYCVSALTRCEETHQHVCLNFPAHIVADQNYFRWNVPQGLSAIGVEEWKNIGDVVALTNKYMKQWTVENVRL